MARPALNPEEKRKQIAVRFGPEDRERLEQLATAEGTSPGKVAEARAAALLGADSATFALLVEIAGEIADIEMMAGGIKWHEDLTTWGAVAEMLARGPIVGRKPESVYTDGGYAAANRERAQAMLKKRDIIERLGVTGVSVSFEPSVERSARGLFGSLLSRYVDRRATEQALIDAIADDATRTRAQALHDELKKLDAAEADEEAEMSDADRIYREMEDAGRTRYRRQQMARLIDRANAFAKQGRGG